MPLTLGDQTVHVPADVDPSVVDDIFGDNRQSTRSDMDQAERHSGCRQRVRKVGFPGTIVDLIKSIAAADLGGVS